jgi:surface antigen
MQKTIYRQEGMRVVLAAVILSLTAAMTGCSGTTGKGPAAGINALDLGTAPLPDYRVGTMLIYSDGSWDKVRGKTGEAVSWMHNGGRLSEGTADFTLRSARWQTDGRQGTRQFSPARFMVEKPAASLWPLAVGNATAFDEIGKWTTERGVSKQSTVFWRCEVQGTEEISVAAGTFPTWKIGCTSYRVNPKKPAVKSATEYRTWYYAPAVGHWVLEEKEFKGDRPNIRKELVAVVPDLLAVAGSETERSQIETQLQGALENKKSGVTTTWKNTGETLSVSLTPTRTLRDARGTICRQYTQHISSGTGKIDSYGVACRMPGGRWQIPRS